MQGLDPSSYERLIELARVEDLGDGDVTSEVTIPAEQQGRGELVFREAGVVCGMGVVKAVLGAYDGQLVLEGAVADGEVVSAGVNVGSVRGSLRSLLAAERVMLNFLQRLSGIATVTSQFVRAVEGTGVQVCDTRKTTPGWRELAKYAVRCGGGTNHRQGLYDAVLIKDNHLAALGAANLRVAVTRGVELIRQRGRRLQFVEVEVDTLGQLAEVLGVEGVDIVLLDNMTTEQLAEAVVMRDRLCGSGKVLLEASGGVTLEAVRAIAESGVDRVSVGALTHSVRSLDIGFDLR